MITQGDIIKGLLLGNWLTQYSPTRRRETCKVDYLAQLRINIDRNYITKVTGIKAQAYSDMK